MNPLRQVIYAVRADHPETHQFDVQMEVPIATAGSQLLAMPAWIPGSYMIRDFAKNIVTLDARQHGDPVSTCKIDKQTWLCSGLSEGRLSVSYRVYAGELSVRTAHLDTTHGYFNGSAVFLRPLGLDDLRCQLHVLRPRGKRYHNWRLATSLHPTTVGRDGFGCYAATSYWDLIDHPVEIGVFHLLSFEQTGVPHRVAISGRQRADTERLKNDLARICAVQVRLFGQLPVDRYLFLISVVGDGYGGLEHANSCSLLCSREDLPRPAMGAPDEGYRRLLALCSHEYFHLWMVKRIQPAVLQDATLEREAHTRSLWAFEGITSYFDALMLLRAGIISRESYLELVARDITRLIRGSGRLKQTLEESSFDAWTKFYKQDENAPNAIVSYYTKGALVALALDLHIRLHSRGAKSLDDVMRALWEQHGATQTGVPESGVEAVAADATGLNLEPFFDLALRHTKDLPLAEQLAEYGVGMGLRAADSIQDQGGFVSAIPKPPSRQRKVLGAKILASGIETRLLQVFDGGAAQTAGLSAGDVIVAIDGIRATPENLERLVDRVAEGQSARMHAFRRDELMEFELTPQPAPLDTCDLWFDGAATLEQLQRRDLWLSTWSDKQSACTSASA